MSQLLANLDKKGLHFVKVPSLVSFVEHAIKLTLNC